MKRLAFIFVVLIAGCRQTFTYAPPTTLIVTLEPWPPAGTVDAPTTRPATQPGSGK